MDRLIVYPGAIPLETDILTSQKNALIGLSKLAAAVLGTSTIVNGLTCVPTGPASLQVVVNPGEIYSLVNVDGTSYGSLAADTTHQILKQGILMDAATLSCPAPGTGGFSINYLVESQYQDLDGTPIVLPYYNSSNPAVAYSGPGNTGVAQNTVRQGKCVVQVKAGTAAATGSQTTPTADAGFTGLWVVTVANGQTQITSPNIVAAAGAPTLNFTLPQAAPLASPGLTGNPTAPTQSLGDNSTKLATTAFVLANLPKAPVLQTFTAGGTYTPTAGMRSCKVTAVGGGAAGGGCVATGAATVSVGGGGGAGGIAISFLTAAQIGASKSVTVGAGGTGVSGASGNNGGASSLGVLVQSGGGSGGSAGAAAGNPAGNGGAGGSATTGAILVVGGDGNYGMGSQPGSFVYSGSGANSMFGGAGRSIAAASNVGPVAGSAASGYGSGGGGALVGNSGSASAGGAGGSGIVVVEEYF